MLRNRFPVLLLLLVLVVSISPVLSLREGGRGSQQAVDLVRMDIDEEEIPIDISFNGSFTGQFHCSATLIPDLGLVIDYVDLYIEPRFPEYISVVLDDYEVRLTSEDPVYHFVANVTVNPGTSASLNPVVVMGGTAKTNHGTDGGVVTDSASIEVLPYYSAAIFFEVPTGSMDIGSSKTFSLTLSNIGNAGENFILSITNTEFLASKGIEVTLPESRVYVDEGEKKVVDVKVRVDGNARRGAYIIKMAVWSEKNGHPTEEDTTASLTLNVDEHYIDLVEGFIKDPLYLWVGLAVIVVLLGLALYGLFKLREHILWKRTLERVRNANLAEDLPVEEEP